MLKLSLQLDNSYRVLFLVENGRDCIGSELELLQKSSKADYAKTIKALELLSERGPLRNKEKFRHERDQIYALKEGQCRIYGFQLDSKSWVFTEFDRKKKDKANGNLLDRAVSKRKEILALKRADALIID